jgi:CheY-like chemotaxis protein
MAENVATKRVLIVDDHSDTVMVMQRLLVQKGYDVKTAESFNDAVRAASDGPFDLILADISLPDGDGLQLLGEFTRRGSPTIKGIALSGYGMPEDIERTRNAGFAGHLTKPVQFSQLTSMIENLLR